MRGDIAIVMLHQVSVVCPTYNRRALLAQCAESVLSLDALEMVIIDDCSTDDTAVLCKDLQTRYGGDRVTVHRFTERSGAQRARNKGIDLATGALLMFVDSDDVIMPAGVARLHERLVEAPLLDFVFGKVVRADASLRPIDGAPIGEPYSPLPVDIGGYHWHTMGAVYRRSFIDKVGRWNEDLTGSQDWEFQARVKIADGTG